MKRGKTYKLSELKEGDRFTVVGSNTVYQKSRTGVVIGAIVDSKQKGAYIEGFAKHMKECEVKFLRNVFD